MVSVNFCPYQCNASKADGLPGYTKHVVKRIFEDAGYKVSYEMRPIGRALKEVELGKFAAIPMAQTTSAQRLLLSKRRIASLRQTFYIRNDNAWRYQDIPSLRGVLVGSIAGYNYSVVDVAYHRYLETHKSDTSRVFELAGESASKRVFRMILRGRLTTFNEDQGVFQFLTKHLKGADRLIAAGELGRVDMHFAVSSVRKDAKELLAIFDAGIERLRQSGELTAILAPYHLKDWRD